MQTGKKFGRYEIREKIGSGGMGEVFSAFDPELNRRVALKILNADYSADEQKKIRFRREARAASALNHPNIITIYEIGEIDSELFIATELIDGKTLREVIRRSPLHLLQTVQIAAQMADALAAAHGAGIVHRDIKPENVMVRDDGYVKVLDFGLAKPTIENEGQLSTDEIIKTTPGLVIGSVRYMSPEQARGIKIDERTDLWSLGVVLYEMLRGTAPFDGATTSDTLANVIYQTPPSILEVLPGAPAEIDSIIQKALQKEVEHRYQNARQLAADLRSLLTRVEHEFSLESQKQLARNDFSISENPTIIHQTASANHPTQTSGPAVVGTQTTPRAMSDRRSSRRGLWAAGVVLFMAVLAFGAFRWLDIRMDSSLTAFEKTQISRLNANGRVRLSTISPDGKYVAYVSGDVGNRSLVVRQVATDSVVTVVPPNVLDFRTVTFTPDGNHILYTQSGKDFTVNTLYQVPTLGGVPKKLIEDVDSMPTFSPDEKRLAFIRHSSKGGTDIVFTANIDGTNLQEVVTNKETTFDFFNIAAWSPDGSKILVSAGNSIGGVNKGSYLLEISLADKGFRKLSEKPWWNISDILWFNDGENLLITAREEEDGPSQIWRISAATGEFAAVTKDVNNYFNIGLSKDDSTIIAVKSDAFYSVWNFSPANRAAVQIIPDSPNFEGAGGLAQTAAGKIVYTRRDAKDTHIWMADADGKNARQLTTESTDDYSPVVSPDGKYIVFGSLRSGTARIWKMDLDGKNKIQLTEEDPTSGDYNPVITADSKYVIFNKSFVGDKQPSTLLKVPIDGGKSETILAKDGFSSFSPQLSPDNKKIIYTAYNIENFEKKLYLAEFDGDRVGAEIATFEYNLINKFIFSPDGKSLTYSSIDGVPNLWTITLDGKQTRPLTNFTSGRVNNFAWSHDGKTLFVVRPIVNNDLILIKDSNKKN
jgi:serine/threonine protein kinase/Tol biopolymer transport system component